MRGGRSGKGIRKEASRRNELDAPSYVDRHFNVQSKAGNSM